MSITLDAAELSNGVRLPYGGDGLDHDADVLGVLEPERPGEDREPPEQLLLVLGQQRVARVNRRLQSAPAPEDAEAPLEALGDRGGRERPQPAGGQFDRQRQTVEATDLGDGRALGGVGDPVGERRASALQEQLLGGAGVERAHRHDRLAGDAERPAACHEDAHVAARGREVADYGTEVGDKMLGPVEHHEQPGGAEALAEDAEGVAALTGPAEGDRRRGATASSYLAGDPAPPPSRRALTHGRSVTPRTGPTSVSSSATSGAKCC
jgi:hypothetical protein